MIACASPLKSERLGALSLSWQFGSPFPTPMSLPEPETLNVTLLFAVGTSRPSLSKPSTRRTDTSSPSASISVRSGVSRMEATEPVVPRQNSIRGKLDMTLELKSALQEPGDREDSYSFSAKSDEDNA